MIKCSHSAICALRSKKTIALDQIWSQPQPTIASHANPTVSASARLNNNRTAQEEIIMQKQTSRLAGRA